MLYYIYQKKEAATMTNREIDAHELTERIAALLEEYGSIALSLPGGRFFLLRDGDQLLLRLGFGQRYAGS
jgi:hypothetical protein